MKTILLAVLLSINTAFASEPLKGIWTRINANTVIRLINSIFAFIRDMLEVNLTSSTIAKFRPSNSGPCMQFTETA